MCVCVCLCVANTLSSYLCFHFLELICYKNLSQNELNPCNECQGYLCNNCYNNHFKEFPDHSSINKKLLIKNFKKENNEPNYESERKSSSSKKPLPSNQNQNIPNQKCMYCDSNISNYNESMPCYGYICPSCKEKNANQNKYLLVQNTTNDQSYNNSHVSCIICGNYLLNEINKNINYCKNCQGNLCEKCANIHLKNYPNHNLLPTKYKLTEFVSYNDLPSSPNLNKCALCDVVFDSKYFAPVYYCNKCNAKICQNCTEEHNNEFRDHILVSSNRLNKVINVGEKKRCICRFCRL